MMIRRLAILLIAAFALAAAASAQTGGSTPFNPIVSAGNPNSASIPCTPPSAGAPARMLAWDKTNFVWYYCSATNTWTKFGTGTGSGTVGNCSTVGGWAYYAATGTTTSCLPFSVASLTALQGTDTSVMTAGTVSGTGASLCTDANGGATTSGCSSGGVTTTNSAPGADTLSANGNFATTQAIAGNAAVAGDIWEVVYDGIETITSTENHQLTLKLGSTAITTPIGHSSSVASAQKWTARARLTFQKIGASGLVYCEMWITQQQAQLGAVSLAQTGNFNWFETNGSALSSIASFTSTPISVDTTASIPITLAATGITNSGSMQLQHATFQKYH